MFNKIKKILLNKNGSVLIEALISIFVVGSLFISVALSVTVAASNTKKVQELNDVSNYAQKICDYMMATSETNSGYDFFESVKNKYGKVNEETEIDMYDIELLMMNNNSNIRCQSCNTQVTYDPNLGGYYCTSCKTLQKAPIKTISQFFDDSDDYNVKFFLIPNGDTYSKSHILTFHPDIPAVVDGDEKGTGLLNTKAFENLYTFKITVSKATTAWGTKNYYINQNNVASISYIFQINVN